jgi:hypothetical protein
MAKEQNNPRIRTRLGGTANDKLRYRHSDEFRCTAKKRSVPCDVLDTDFGNLVKGLYIRTDQQDTILRLSAELIKAQHQNTDAQFEEKQRENAINSCKKRYAAIQHIYKRGEMTPEEYEIEIEEVKRELAYWQNYTTDLEQSLVELGQCIQAVNQITNFWDTSTVEERHKMVSAIFQGVFYDLDRQRITNIELQPWAERFIVLRYSLLTGTDDPTKPIVQEVPLEGIEPPAFRLEGDCSIL